MELDPKRLERLNAPDANLKKGAGKGINGGFDACVMQAVHYVSGGDGSSDHPECASRAITGFCIVLNDAEVFGEYRNELLVLVPQIAGTRRDLSLEVYLAAEYAEYAAKYAEYAAEYAAESAEYAAKSAKYAAKSAEYAAYAEYAAAYAAKSAAKSAEYAAKDKVRSVWLEALDFLKLMISIANNWPT